MCKVQFSGNRRKKNATQVFRQCVRNYAQVNFSPLIKNPSTTFSALTVWLRVYSEKISFRWRICIIFEWVSFNGKSVGWKSSYCTQTYLNHHEKAFNSLMERKWVGEIRGNFYDYLIKLFNQAKANLISLTGI